MNAKELIAQQIGEMLEKAMNLDTQDKRDYGMQLRRRAINAFREDKLAVAQMFVVELDLLVEGNAEPGVI